VGILEEDIARVREATDTAAVVGEQVALRRVGNRLVGLCPFHTEKSPSFSVNASEGLYYCFGCQARGDIITFVRETQHLDFSEAVHWLASRAGIALRYDTPGATREHHRRGVLTEAMQVAVDWYHERLLTSPDAAVARRYLRHDRGYDGEIVRAFKMGWAPEGWDQLCRTSGIPLDTLREVGLATRSRNGNHIDVFRSRVMFPIFDVDAKPVGFGGRVLPGGGGPKYVNSSEGPLYSKRRVLYGLNWAKEDVVAKGEVIVCEGYTDVIGFHHAGVPRAVATCGTALADEHMQRLKNFARRIILAYDADAAGQGAAEKFYAWEQKLELDIHVLRLPPGADPGELGAKDPAALSDAVAQARPFLAFRVDRILDAADTSTPEGRARAAERALVAIAAHPSDLVRDQYVMQVADRTRVSADSLRARLEEVRQAPAVRPGGHGPGEARGRSGGSGPGDGRGRPGGGGPGRGRSGGPGTGPDGSDRSGERARSAPDDAPPWGDEGGWADDGRYEPDGEWAGSPDDDRGSARGRTGGGGGRGGSSSATTGWAPNRATKAHPVEEEALRLAIHRPASVAHLMEPVLFDDPFNLAALQALLSAPTLAEAIDAADSDVASILLRLAVEDVADDVDADDVLAILVRAASARVVAAVDAEVRQHDSSDNLRWAADRIRMMGWAKERMEALSDTDRRVEAMGQLVAWLASSGEEGA
jgi:DNA primase